MHGAPPPIGIFGGTFDPIHYGHLRAALELLETLGLAEIRFIPCHIPAHRVTPAITPQERLALVQLATADQQNFIVDERELHRSGPSYMVDTLAALRSEVGDTPLCLLLGIDAFRALHTWHRWTEIIDHAHIVVMDRPGIAQPFPSALETFIASHRIDAIKDLHHAPSGGILFQSVTQLDISATRIRNLLANGRSVRYLVPEAVLIALHQHAFYQ